MMTSVESSIFGDSVNSDGEEQCTPLTFLSCVWLGWGQPSVEQVMKAEMRKLRSSVYRLAREEATTKRQIEIQLANVKTQAFKNDMLLARRAAKLVFQQKKRRERLWKQQDNINQLLDRVGQQNSSAQVDRSLIRVLGVMAARNGNVTPQRYRELMQLHERIKNGQEMRDDLFDEIIGGENENETAGAGNTGDDDSGLDEQMFQEILAESGFVHAKVPVAAAVTSIRPKAVAMETVDDLDERLRQLRK